MVPANLVHFLSLSLSPASKAIIKKRVRRLMDGGGAFQCRTCGRRFATFQALGGHRTSHKRPRVRADGLDLLLGARPVKGAAAKQDVLHRCHTCGTAFPTGQALGGHMRRHRAATFNFNVPALEFMPTMTTSGSSEERDDGTEEDLLSNNRTLIHFI